MKTAARVMMFNKMGKHEDTEHSGHDRQNYSRREMERETQSLDRERANQRAGSRNESRENAKWRGNSWDEDRDDWRDDGGGYAGNFRSGAHPREHSSEEVKFDEHKAKEWVEHMKNSDGTTGDHFKPETAEQLRGTICPDCDKHEFWAAMNMMYSDYCDVAKKYNADRPEFYGHMAKSFLMDKDAEEDKLAKYMKYIAGK